MPKYVEKFRKEKDYNDDYAFKMNMYDRKQRDKQRESKKQAKYFDSYNYDLYQENRKYRK